MAKRKIKVLLADDHNVLREGLRAMLETEPDVVVVADVGDGNSAVKKVKELSPDVVIMDISMPDLNGIDATRRIKNEQFKGQVLCLSVHREKQLIQSMLQAGANGYILKTCVRKELTEAVRAVDAGEIYLSPMIALDIINQHVRGQTAQSRNNAFAELTDREREVLQLTAEGHNSKNIAEQLGIAQKTALLHRQNCMKKLNIDSIAGLTRYAIREGIVCL